jgi:DNA-binding transcriptional MerR regulator
MDLVPIGEAARLLGVNTSALRYYEDRELVRPERRGGQRMYSREDLRRLAFIQITHRLGLGLRTAGAVLDEPGAEWRRLAKEQVTRLTELIEQAQVAQRFLAHALDCPAEHPVRECPHLIGILDRRIDGVSLERLAAEHAQDH